MGRTVKEVTSEHRRVAYLKSQGATYGEIAEETGYSESHIKAILRNPEIKELVQSERIWDDKTKQEESVEKVIARASLNAIHLLEQIVKDSETLGDHAPTTKQRMDAAREILEMAGYAGRQRVDHTHRHVLQPADFKEIRERAERPQIIDVEATPCLEAASTD